VRPIRLELEGFGAFRDRTEVDFDDVELFALVGPTGAGKSTLIDAICFVLYGSVPRLGDRKRVADVLTTGALQARVSLTFAVGDQEYVATRVVRRTKTNVSTREARLEELDGEVLAGSAREMDAQVERLLGLTFEHFTRAVVLPQGEFARFLHDAPSARQDLLVRLLGFDVYERMMQRANARAAELRAASERAELRIADLADCTPDQRAVWTEWAAHYDELRSEVRAARESAIAIAREAETAQAEADRLHGLVAALRRVEQPEEVARAGADRAAADAALEAAAADAEGREHELDAARAARAEVGDRDEWLAWRAAHADLADVRKELKSGRAALKEREREAEAARAAHEAAQRELEEVRAARAAHALVGRLHEGEPCPLCLQPITTVPHHPEPPEWKSARAKVERTEPAAQSASDRAAAARQRVEDLETRVAGLEQQLTDAPDAKAVAAHLKQIDAAEAAVEQATKAERAARDARDRAGRARAQVDERLAQATGTFRAQRDALVQHGVDVPPESGDLAADWPALVTWAQDEIPATERTTQAAVERADERRRAAQEQTAAIVARAIESEVDVAPDADLERLTDAVAAAHEHAKREVTRIEAGIAERAKLEAEVAAQREEAAAAEQLGRLLDARNFERWLVLEALELLVEGASARLRELSNGQYSLALADGRNEFLVVDHTNADEPRSVRTLSGGETFQASLALALALADQLGDLAADGAARLESIYLDEGFGTLDPDTLETVAGTIEQLGAGRRTVGIITHVRELAERMPVRYRVVKGPRTATVERIEQGAQ
jgi:exonuclease SbcC